MLPLILKRAGILAAVCFAAAGMLAFVQASCSKGAGGKAQSWLYGAFKPAHGFGSFVCAEYGIRAEHL